MVVGEALIRLKEAPCNLGLSGFPAQDGGDSVCYT